MSWWLKENSILPLNTWEMISDFSFVRPHQYFQLRLHSVTKLPWLCFITILSVVFQKDVDTPTFFKAESFWSFIQSVFFDCARDSIGVYDSTRFVYACDYLLQLQKLAVLPTSIFSSLPTVSFLPALDRTTFVFPIECINVVLLRMPYFDKMLFNSTVGTTLYAA